MYYTWKIVCVTLYCYAHGIIPRCLQTIGICLQTIGICLQTIMLAPQVVCDASVHGPPLGAVSVTQPPQ